MNRGYFFAYRLLSIIMIWLGGLWMVDHILGLPVLPEYAQHVIEAIFVGYGFVAGIYVYLKIGALMDNLND